MLNLRSFALLAAFGALTACGATSSRNIDRSAIVDGTQVTIKDYQKISNQDLSALALQPDESLYLVSAFKAVSVTLPDGEHVSSDKDCYKRASTVTVEHVYVYPSATPKLRRRPVLDQDKAKDCTDRLKVAQRNANQRSFSALQALAERAVKQEGSCSWGGYDRSFDMRARSVTSVMRLDDDRIFFAKMRCVG